jgi:hypothetical protein
LSRIPVNPYQPANDTVAGHALRPRWWLRFFVLNLILFLVPIVVAVVSGASVFIDFAFRPDNINGDPVTYQYQHFSVSGTIWTIAAYFSVPNVVLVAIWSWQLAVQHTRQRLWPDDDDN